MLVRDEFVKNNETWCGLNRPQMKEEEADIVIFGIPFDGGVSYRGGAAEAPKILRATHFAPRHAQSGWTISIP